MPTRTNRAKRQRHSAAQWQAWLQEFASSGLSQSEFCRRKGLTLSAFHSWRKKLEQVPAPTPPSLPEPFIEIKPPSAHIIASDASRPATWDLELELGHGRIL